MCIRDRDTYVVSNGYAPGGRQTELLYDQEKEPWQISPRLIEAGCRTPEILGFRKCLKGYLEMIQDPFLWDKDRQPV